MTKIKVSTSAAKEFDCDKMTVTFTVAVHDNDSTIAAKAGKEQTEKLLAALEEKVSIKPEDIVFERENVGSSYYRENNGCSYTKKLEFSAKADMALVSNLADIAKELKYVGYDVDFSLLDRKAKEDEVLASATEDSRKKAEIIAKGLGLKITGIDEVSFGGEMVCLCEQASPMALSAQPQGRSAMVALPKEKIESSVEITWLAEVVNSEY